MSESEQKKSPFTEPWFVASTAVVGVLVVAGAVIAGVTLFGSDEDTTSSATVPSSDPSPETTYADNLDLTTSICGLEGEVLSGSLDAAPTVDEWRFEGVTPYPTSEHYGPGATAAEGYRYCYQHSPEGALYAATSVLAVPRGEGGRAWGDYIASQGTYRPETQTDSDSWGNGDNGVGTDRWDLRGFRILEYTGTTARVDVAWNYASQSTSGDLSVVVELIWEAGDWKVNTNYQEPIAIGPVTSLQAYSPWTVTP